jgi:hypothetical protein
MSKPETNPSVQAIGINRFCGVTINILVQVPFTPYVTNRIPRRPPAEPTAVVAVAVELQAGFGVALPASIQVRVAGPEKGTFCFIRKVECPLFWSFSGPPPLLIVGLSPTESVRAMPVLHFYWDEP